MDILIVDDEKEIADLVELYLLNEGYSVHKFYRGEDAIQYIDNNKVDLAIIDLMLPDIDGFTICSKIREKHNFPVIMLTAKVNDIDKINGLNLGADDYITKPFKPLELIARVKAQLRRYKDYNNFKQIDKDKLIIIRGLNLDLDKHKATLDDKNLNLTPTEFQILKVLMENADKVVSSDDLFQKVWKEKYFSSANNTIMVHIRHIREKMKDSFDNPNYIKTVWGVGYKIEK